MPREPVHYEGKLIDLPPRTLPGGGWLEWDVTWRGPDGTRHPVSRLRAEAEGGAATARSQGGRGWKLSVSGTAETPAAPAPLPRNRMRHRQRTERPVNYSSLVTVTALALIEGEWMPVARQVVFL